MSTKRLAWNFVWVRVVCLFIVGMSAPSPIRRRSAAMPDGRHRHRAEVTPEHKEAR